MECLKVQPPCNKLDRIQLSTRSTLVCRYLRLLYTGGRLVFCVFSFAQTFGKWLVCWMMIMNVLAFCQILLIIIEVKICVNILSKPLNQFSLLIPDSFSVIQLEIFKSRVVGLVTDTSLEIYRLSNFILEPLVK